MTEERFIKFGLGNSNLQILDKWITEDVRKGREEEKWLNLILQKAR